MKKRIFTITAGTLLVFSLGSIASSKTVAAAHNRSDWLQARAGTVTENRLVTVTDIKFPTKWVELVPHEELGLQPQLSPVGATNDLLTWWSSNNGIVKVDNQGKITGVRKGKADIYAMSKDGRVRDWVEITVRDGYLMPTDITVTPTVATVEIGTKLTMTHKVAPAITPYQYASWTSSDESIATVSRNGVVTGVKPGKVTLTATSAVESVKATSEITVKYGANIPMTSISLTPKTNSIVARETFKYEPLIEPSFATDKGINWYSDNHKVVTVAADGTVTGIGVGTTTIHAIAKDLGARDSVTVTVRPGALPITGIEVKPEKADLEVGKELTLSHKIIPEAAEYLYADWTSSDKTIATVSNRGVVKGLKPGNVTITATSANKKIKASSQITVKYGSTIPVNSIVLSPKEKELVLNETFQYQAAVKPDNATDKGLVWATTNSNVVRVDQTGLVTAVKKGRADIYATSKDGKVRDWAEINVKDGYLPVTGIEVTPASATVEIGTDLTLTHKIIPASALEQYARWSSSDESIATVSNKGVVKGVKPGNVTITATSANQAIKATSQITVKYGATIPVNAISISPTEKELIVKETYQFGQPVVKPDNATDKSVNWSSSNSSIISVDANGKVTANKKGAVYIYAYSKDGKVRGQSLVRAKEGNLPITGIAVSPAVATVEIGTDLSLKHTVTPRETLYHTADWSSSDTTVATVSRTGVVTGIRPGNVTITAVSNDPAIKATSQITVKYGATIPVNSIVLSPKELKLVPKETYQYTPTIKPDNATDKTLIWSSSNSNIATVDSNGKVTAVRQGTTDIYARTKDGKVRDWAEITVTDGFLPITGITVSPAVANLDVGSVLSLTHQITPTNAQLQYAKWTSSDNTIATVDYRGNVTGIKPGVVTITGTSGDDRVSATSTITVSFGANIPVSGIIITPYNPTMRVGARLKLNPIIVPANATDKELVWLTNDSRVFKITEKGEVTALRRGVADAIATSKDGKVRDWVEITVR